MKKETLIKLIDEEFGENETNWIVDLFLRSFSRNDNRILKASEGYIERAKLIRDTLFDLSAKIKEMEKAEDKAGVRLVRVREIVKGESK